MHETGLRIQACSSAADIRTFIQLPFQWYAGSRRWVPPLLMDEYAFHDAAKNPAFASATVQHWIAWRGQQPVGRIMGIIHHAYNKSSGELLARFYQLDAIEDVSVVTALLTTVENWARANNMSGIMGPFGFSDKDPQGIQVEGFDWLPVIATPTNPAYLPPMLDANGYTKKTDCVSYRIPIPPVMPPVYGRVTERLLRTHRFRLIECKQQRELKPYILPVFRLVNETYGHLLGFVPMTETEMQKMAKQYLPVLDPHFVKLVLDANDKLIAFVVAMPDMSPGLQKARGKLFPFGFWHIWRAMKQTQQLNLLLGAVHPQCRGKGLDVLMGAALMRAAANRGMKYMDSHLILESNTVMRAECEKINGELYKRFRIYQKQF